MRVMSQAQTKLTLFYWDRYSLFTRFSLISLDSYCCFWTDPKVMGELNSWVYELDLVCLGKFLLD